MHALTQLMECFFCWFQLDVDLEDSSEDDWPEGENHVVEGD